MSLQVNGMALTKLLARGGNSVVHQPAWAMSDTRRNELTKRPSVGTSQMAMMIQVTRWRGSRRPIAVS